MLIVETPRLTLRRFSLADLEALATILSDPEVMYFSLTRQPLSRTETATFITTHRDRTVTPQGGGLYAVVERASAQLLGYCGLIRQIIDDQPMIEIGYRLGRSAWGQGFATEAARAVRDHAAALGIPRVIALIEPENGRSRRVAAKIGMHWQRDLLIHAIPVQLYGMELPPAC